ncbi:hypothetical protein JQ557_07455 [Bradyrhizobium sp. U87765 SZCCT0131]|uniref:hypothetical protein n=1 Tax=unclassified Bradyrhizobium TaxID=2631580 RepID=UPI001BA6E961|nr:MULTISPECIES: hypothetical protein [unclassified Bradyrhizobium]MBR1217819.1 hypothetical protein [Bradyrhizobium sp. U87765 SZCCT0131]MBR1261235.1 hypothetical protein [Bradyrhizobium sp. U87765 SZCCT0134]MBR1303317.1 hypothetical protein [Bradyrhizobium sp. U87765 SZCCT0110]MBR1318923.1 hypothetical protein [Bradyrhizobium sp. U87765 SZCCT0109]MBR1347248.1 hypothetical protein [Bradyrhizobium sp. U87765 SZCCT0048]
MAGIVLDSITELPPDVAGRPVVAASHGGIYSARCALGAAAGGVIFCDAGIGREQAGVAGLALLDAHGIPAAAVSHASARIGDGADCLARGVLSVVNEAARRCGLREGMRAATAFALLQDMPAWSRDGGDRRADGRSASINGAGNGCGSEVRFAMAEFLPVPVVTIDSNSLVTPADAEAIVLTGSHGALLGGRSASAIKHRVFAVVYNDADVGADGAGISRLGALDALGIPAATVSAWSARIGDGRSTLADGFITHVNRSAAAIGGERGISSAAFVSRLAEVWIDTKRSEP